MQTELIQLKLLLIKMGVLDEKIKEFLTINNIKDYGRPDQTTLLNIYSRRLEMLKTLGSSDKKYEEISKLVENLKRNSYVGIRCVGLLDSLGLAKFFIFITNDFEKLIGIINANDFAGEAE